MDAVLHYIDGAVAYVITTTVGAVIGALAMLVKKHHDESVGLKESQRYLLKDRITQACQHWLAVGYCPIYNREVIVEMTDSYHKLGGNSFISGLVEKVLALPIEPNGECHEED